MSSKRRKHVLQNALQEDVEPPTETQRIVQAVGSRGGNHVEVSYPNGKNTLVLLPAKYNKKLWVRRGGYVIIDEGDADSTGDNRVTGTIVSVLYDADVRQLKKLPGVWPTEFNIEALAAAAESPGSQTAAALRKKGSAASPDGRLSSESSDDGLPPLTRNQNRQIIEYYVSDDTDEE